MASTARTQAARLRSAVADLGPGLYADRLPAAVPTLKSLLERAKTTKRAAEAYGQMAMQSYGPGCHPDDVCDRQSELDDDARDAADAVREHLFERDGLTTSDANFLGEIL